MNKEEILRRSRAENNDEGEIHAQKTGHSLGFIAMTIMYLAVALANLLCGGRVSALAPCHAIYFTGMGMKFIGYAKTSTQKTILTSGIIVMLFGIAFFILYVTDLLA